MIAVRRCVIAFRAIHGFCSLIFRFVIFSVFRRLAIGESHRDCAVICGITINKPARVSARACYNKLKYSLQGTTQGRYLTGGVPPVRFSM